MFQSFSAEINGLTVRQAWFNRSEEAVARLTSVLEHIRIVAPIQLARAQRDVRFIKITAELHQSHPDGRILVSDHDLLTSSEEWNAVQLVGSFTWVHLYRHARVNSQNSFRVRRIAFEEQVNFARRMGIDHFVEHLTETWDSGFFEDQKSTAARRKAFEESADRLQVPKWMRRSMLWWMDHRGW
jgi:hypothetical protein